jgi:hypothetical protein
MSRKTRTKGAVLPAILILRVINDDLKDAICGSPTRCAIANAVRRTFSPEPTYVKVKENRVTITWKQMLHHYEVTRHALGLVAQNDDGSLTLRPDTSHTLRLPRIRVMRAHINLTAERRKQIREAEKAAACARAEAGLPPKKYAKNTRLLAAKNAGLALKKLHAAAH